MRRFLLAFLTLALGSLSSATAQCRDWAYGFGIPGNGLDNQVNALAAFDSGSGTKLYVSGFFENYGSPATPMYRMATWNGSGWTPVPNGVGANSMLAITDGSGPGLIVTGGFNNGAGIGARYIARWSGSGWSNLGTGLNNNGHALALFDDGTGAALYVGGSFSDAGGVSAGSIARWDGTAWSSVYSSTSGARFGASMAFDDVRGRAVLFGGTTQGGGSLLGDTWEWDGSSWSRRATTGPSPRGLAAMTFDSARGRTVLFGGGWISNSFSNQTWEWDGASWVQVNVAGPSQRIRSSMAYDSVRQRMVLHGGDATSGYLGDTWEYDGSSWTQLAASGPGLRSGHGMAFDDARGVTILYGGYRPGSGYLSDTWEFDGTAWTLRSTSGPGPRSAYAMAFDSARGRTVLFGGEGGPSPDDQTWEWNGTSWTVVATTGPGSRVNAAMCYDASRQRTVLMGGTGLGLRQDTWVWSGTSWAAAGGGFNNSVDALAVYNDGTGPALYAGGRFTNISGTAANYIARYTAGGWSSVGPAFPARPNSPVAALCVFNDGSGAALYAGDSDGVAKWNGATWTAVGGSLEGAQGVGVTDLKVFNDGSGDALYACGAFLYGTTSNGLIAKLSGGTWAPLGTGLRMPAQGNRANCMAGVNLGDGPRLFVGGSFDAAGEKPARRIAEWNVACSAPIILQHPQSVIAVVGQPLHLSVTATGTAALSYQWRRDGVNLVPNSQTPNVTGPVLSFNWWSLNDIGDYDVVVTNALGQAISNPAEITIPVPGTGPIAVTPVLYPPQPAPGRPDFTLTNFATQLLSDQGQVWFAATAVSPTSTGTLSLGLYEQGTLSIPFMHQDPAPGTAAGVYFSQFGEFTMTTDATLAFNSRISGPGINGGVNDLGIWVRDAQGTVLAARTGSQAAGTPSGVVFQDFGSPFLNAGGTILFYARLSGPGVTTANETGLWQWSRANGATLAVRAGSPAPGTALTFAGFSPTPELADDGQIAFRGRLSDNAWGVWKGMPGALSLILKNGDPAPGASGYTVTQIFGFVLGRSGRLLVDANLGGPQNGWGLYRLDGTTLTPLTNPGMQAPGAAAGATYFRARPAAITADGTSLFVANLQNAGSGPTAGIWRADASGLSPVALQGTQMPGLGSLTFGTFDETPAAMNEHGHVMFGTGYAGGHVFGWTPSTGLFPIAVLGSQLEILPGVFRTVQSSFFSARIANGGNPMTSASLNQDGKLVLSILFTDSKRGIFTGDFPEFAGSYVPCPNVLVNPDPQAVYPGQTATFSVVASGDEVQYQWRKNGSPIGDGGGYSGTGTSTLVVQPVASSHAGTYEVQVSNTCTTVTSAPAVLTVLCYPNCDQSVIVPILNVADFTCFLQQFAAGNAYANCDNSVIPPTLNVADFTCFLQRFAAGCQ